MEKRISKRRYPERICEKPSCSQKFIPTDAREKHCCKQHRIDKNNDKRRTRTEKQKLLIEKYDHNKAVLFKLFEKLRELKMNKIQKDYLVLEDFDFSLFTNRTVNSQTKNTICWSWDYGIELFDKEGLFFVIHKLEENGNTNSSADF